MKILNLRNEEGSSLVLILLLITVVSILGLSLYRLSLNHYQLAAREEKRVQAYYVAKSGANLVASAIEQELIDSTALKNILKTSKNIGLGSFEVEVEKNGIKTTITSVGTVDNFSQTVYVDLVSISNKDELPILDHAIFADGKIDIGHIEIEGDIGVNKHDNFNKPIEITNVNADILGDIYIGPNGSPDDIQARNVYDGHHGDVINLPEKRNYQLPEYPEFPLIEPYINQELVVDRNKVETTTINSSIWYDSINVNDDLTINVGDQDIYIRTREFKIGGGRNLNINRTGEGKVRLYVEETLTLNSSVNYNGNPEDLFLYYSGDKELNFTGNDQFVGSAYIEKADVKLAGSGGITGNLTTAGENVKLTGNSNTLVRAIYAPEADISIEGSADIRGAIVGKNVNIKGGNKIIYDDSLAGINPENLGFEVIEEYQRTWR